jgi:hypothetical protein
MAAMAGAFIRAFVAAADDLPVRRPIEWTPGVTPVDDDWPITALEVKGQAIRFYDEEKVHFVGIKNVPQSGMGWTDATYTAVNNFEYIEGRPHGVGVCPVVRFRDVWELDGEEQYGIVEPLMNIQKRIDETTYEMSAAQYFTAFMQRWVSGWRPKDESEALAAVAGDTWYFSSKDVKVGSSRPATSRLTSSRSSPRYGIWRRSGRFRSKTWVSTRCPTFPKPPWRGWRRERSVSQRRFRPLWVSRSSRCCGRAPTSPVMKLRR